MSGDEEMDQRAGSFGLVAGPYERLRPKYPAELFDAVMAAAGDRTRIGTLEVGAGGGRATLPLAHRGVDIIAIEPSPEMASILEERLRAEAPRGKVTIRRQSFDDLAVDDGPFGVVIAAQSFHWADPRTRWQRLADLLAADGMAFIFWNEWAIDPQTHDVEAIREVYTRVAPNLVPDIDDGSTGESWAQAELCVEPRLVPVEQRVFGWRTRLRTDDYLGLLATTSQYVVAPQAVTVALFGHLRPLLGEEVSLTGRTVLVAGRPAS